MQRRLNRGKAGPGGDSGKASQAEEAVADGPAVVKEGREAAAAVRAAEDQAWERSCSGVAERVITLIT